MSSTLDIYRRLLLLQFRSQMQYRMSFLFYILNTALITTFEFGSLVLVMQRFENIGGWRLGEVAFLYSIVKAVFSLMDMIFSGFDPPYFGRNVRLGTFDQLLLRPVNITVQVLGSRFELHRLGNIILGLVIFVFAMQLTDIQWTWIKLLYLPLVFLGQICFFGGLFILGSTITFWTVDSIETVNIFTYGGSEMIAYPMHIYHQWMRLFFTFIVPAIFLNYYPALYILDKPDLFNMPPFVFFLAPIVGFISLTAASAFWRFGIKHYQSTGT
ncbi:MAG: ABC-2 family transporter protein [Chloroflexota bacterium]